MNTTKHKPKTAADTTGTLEMTDEELLVRYRETGDRDLFTQLVQRYERELYSYLRRYLGNAEMAEDAFQTTFLQVHLKCNQFNEGRKFRPWLYTISTNQAIDLQRRNKRHRMVSLNRVGAAGGDELGQLIDLLEADEPEPLAQLNDAERRNWVQSALAELPEQLRAAVTLVYYQGLKYREAAEVLSIPVGTVKSRMHSAILKLNEAWHSTNERR
jgi:RNA polymerase sigma-70 factor (ECF subfamily)|tara:strand:+ start:1172 stop:1813 length:642 start_codon:yes stop_codon:yes gene_type:complete